MNETIITDKLSLDGEWELSYLLEKKNQNEVIESNGQVLNWMRTSVPGDCLLELIDKGILPDPFIGLNARRLNEYESCEWWYRKKFIIDKAGNVIDRFRSTTKPDGKKIISLIEKELDK